MTAIRHMSADQLREHMAGIEALNPHCFKTLRSWQIANAKLGRMRAEYERISGRNTEKVTT